MYQSFLPHILPIASIAIVLLLILWLKPLLNPIISSILTTWYRSSLLDKQSQILQASQKKVQETLEPLAMAAAAAEVGMWNWDLETGKIKWSPDLEELFGLVPGTFDGSYETFAACLHPDDKELVEQTLKQAIQNNSFYQQEFRIVWSNGNIHWIEARGNCFYNEAEQPILMTGIATVIDKRRQAQALLKQKFEQQRLVMEINQRIQTSLNLAEILQITVDEIRRLLKTDRVIIFQISSNTQGNISIESVGAEWKSIVSTEINDPGLSKNYIEPYQEGSIIFNSDIYQAEIDPNYLELLTLFQVKANIVASIMKQKELWGLLIVHHCEAPRQWQDTEIELISQLAAQLSIAIQQSELFAQLESELEERKQIEASLRQSELRYRSLVHASAQIVWRTDSEGKAIITPEGWEELTGQPAAECLGWGWLKIVHPDDRNRTAQIWIECCINGNICETEHRLQMKDGNYRNFAVRSVPILDADGKISEWIGICEDITDRKQAEITLQQMNAQLETRVAERTAELQEINHRLQEELLLSSRLQRQLLARERLLNSFFNAASAANIGLAIHDQQLNYIKINQALADINGFSIEAHFGRQLTEIIPDMAPNLIPILQNVINTGQPIRRLEVTGNTKAQPELLHYWLISNFPIFDETGQVNAVGAIVLDITERKRIEEALKHTHHQLTFHMENTPLGTITWDSQLRVKQWSKQAEQIFGWSSSEVLGRKLEDLQLVFTEDRNLVKSIIQNLIEGNTNQCNNRNYRKDGTVIHCEWYNSALLDESGKLVSILSFVQDVSKRKQAEEALRESEEKFRQLAENIHAVFWMKDYQTQKVIYISSAYETIWQRNRESLYQNSLDWLKAVHPDDRHRVEVRYFEGKITGQYDEQYRIICSDGSIRWIRDRTFPIKNEAGEIIRIAGIAEDITKQQQIEQIKNEFIGIVSHELRTPLTAIQMSLGLLQTGVYNKNPEKFQRMLNIALLDTNRLVNLVNDILDLERLDSGRITYEKTICHAVDLIEQAVNGMEALATAQQIILKINPTDAQVLVARDAIVQTLTNLISNALKFSPTNSTITLSAESQTDKVLFQVSDQGRGIPADKLEVIFGRFQQVDASDSREKGGTGLGLAICQRIIQLHGGEIWVESTLGKGSTFFFSLPKPGK